MAHEVVPSFRPPSCTYGRGVAMRSERKKENKHDYVCQFGARQARGV